MRLDDALPKVGIALDGAEPPPSPGAAGATDAARPQAPCRDAIDTEVRHRIGRNLKLLYADMLMQPLPERFETLLAELASRRETS